ncbi:MAG: enoyl-CoA hydratase/isomerase family protein [Xanthomonadales bacterium]|nr:enoyl-CoA hydratase/isomerase family protein [Xanthomonadales bacterium]
MFESKLHGPVSEIRMSHPPVNAIGPEFMEGLIGALNEAAQASRAIVLSGQPGMFSAGLDIVAMSTMDREGIKHFWGLFFEMLRTIGASPVPIAAAITGHSPAGGAVMAIHCDYRVMMKGDWKIGLNEVQVGLVVPPQIQRVLVRLVGKYRAERLLVAGALLSPESALDAGMVDQLADDYETTIAGALDWCTRHASLPPNAMGRTRDMIRADMKANYDDFDETAREAFCDVWFSDETQQVMGQVLARLKAKSA